MKGEENSQQPLSAVTWRCMASHGACFWAGLISRVLGEGDTAWLTPSSDHCLRLFQVAPTSLSETSLHQGFAEI